MSDYVLDVEPRTDGGKGVARKLRARGRIPAVCYGSAEGARGVHLDPHALERILAKSSAGLNTLIDLKGGGPLDGKVVIVKDLQRDPVRGALLHADLYAIDVNRTITVNVPIHLSGTPVGVELGGGILEHTLREVEVECLPRAIPEEIVVDVRALELGSSLHVRDLALPAGVVLVTDPDLSVLSVAAPRVEEAAGEAAVAEGEAAAAEAGEAGAKAGEGD